MESDGSSFGRKTKAPRAGRLSDGCARNLADGIINQAVFLRHAGGSAFGARSESQEKGHGLAGGRAAVRRS